MSTDQKPKVNPADEDESLNLELIRKWEANHPKGASQPVETKDSQKVDK